MADKMEEDNFENEQEGLSNPDVVTKYKAAADIANRALAEVVKQVQPERRIVELCKVGDEFIEKELSQVFTKGKIEKGIAFPTSISVNNCCGHFSPLNDDTTTIKEGDLVKIDLGVQIDGYISLVAHTCFATISPSAITGRQADVVCAAHYAGEVAHRLIRPGRKNTEVTEAINKVAKEFNCNVLEGVLSHQLKRFVIDGNNVIISKETLDHKVEEFEFEELQCYCVDIVMSTGEGKSKELDTRTTIYKRAVEQNYLLKMKAARYVFNEINQRFPTFPFTVRALDEKRGKLGITEMLKHDLLYPYPVLYEKQGEYVAQFKFTVLLLPSATMRLTGHPLPYVSSQHELKDPSILEIMQMSTKRSKKKKKKTKKPKASADEEAMDTN